MLFLYKDRVALTHDRARGSGAYDPAVERHVSIAYVSDSNQSHYRLRPLHPSPVPSVTHRLWSSRPTASRAPLSIISPSP
jgi:hypothetical protein